MLPASILAGVEQRWIHPHLAADNILEHHWSHLWELRWPAWAADGDGWICGRNPTLLFVEGTETFPAVTAAAQSPLAWLGHVWGERGHSLAAQRHQGPCFVPGCSL